MKKYNQIKLPQLDLQSVSIHESGHAVFYYMLGCKIEYTQVFNEVEGIVSCKIFKPTAYTSEHSKELDIKLTVYGMISFSGSMAEFKLHDKVMDLDNLFEDSALYEEYDEDYDDEEMESDSIKFMSEITRANEIIGYEHYGIDFFKEVNNKTKEIMNNKYVWKAVKGLSEILSKKGVLYHKEIHGFLNNCSLPDLYKNYRELYIPESI